MERLALLPRAPAGPSPMVVEPSGVVAYASGPTVCVVDVGLLR